MNLFKKYLEILNLSKKKPSMDFLKELIASHLSTIPFENISKLYYKAEYNLTDIPDFEQYIEGITKYKFGGTCYSINYYFNQLLKHLGYDVILCGADMNSPDVHLVNIVKLENLDFIVDMGYGAPFFDPLPRDITEKYEINFGIDKYVLLPKDPNGHSKLEFYRNDKLKQGYTVKPYSKKISDFKEVISESFSDTSTFMNTVTLVYYRKKYTKRIRNLTITEFLKGSYTERKIKNKIQLAKEIEQEYGIPEKIAFRALEQVKEFGDL